ncbi:hypothetical protein SEA_ATUIN_245 [Arthrobacter phage Atuin]|nr:hypothetical protein SEA_ATUIN_44 [Arthrobacter phage Atuin]
MRSMEDYREEAVRCVDASFGDLGVNANIMCEKASKSILELTGEVERLRKKLKKKNKKIEKLEEYKWMYEDLNN